MALRRALLLAAVGFGIGSPAALHGLRGLDLAPVRRSLPAPRSSLNTPVCAAAAPHGHAGSKIFISSLLIPLPGFFPFRRTPSRAP
jgi:hypothetical protein